jgi:hypothetical protein
MSDRSILLFHGKIREVLGLAEDVEVIGVESSNDPLVIKVFVRSDRFSDDEDYGYSNWPLGERIITSLESAQEREIET